ncbi:MAG TPA: universal stress protein [Anaerolineales bacterium]|nr:universal stress protein [Anaerolineales bacterium]
MSKKILIPLDGSKSAEAILPPVCTLTSEPVSELVLLHVIEYPRELYPVCKDYLPIDPGHAEVIREEKQAILRSRQVYLAGVAARLAMLGYKVSAEISEGPVVQTIIRSAQRMKVDFIALSTRSSNGYRGGEISSVANRLLREAKTPIMVIIHSEQESFKIEPAILYRAVLAGQEVSP